MSGYSLNFCFVTVVLCILWLSVRSQDFCESYEKNNFSLIVFSQSSDTILLIVDKHFWRLRENGTELVFERNDFQASNSSEQWSETDYTFAHSVYAYKKDKTFVEEYRGIALYKDLKNITSEEGWGLLHQFQRDYYYFHDTYFSVIKSRGITNLKADPEKTSRFSFSLFNESRSCEVIESFNKTYNRKVVHIGNYRQLNQSFPDGFEYIENLLNATIIKVRAENQIKKLENFTNDIPMIGTYFNLKNEIICFFRINDYIKYCTIDECDKNNYMVLISCQLKDKTIDTTIDIRIPIAIICVIIVVFVIIVLIVIYCLRKSKGKTGVKIDWENVSTVKTINSKTGLPLHASKTEKPGTSGKRVSPPKPQNKTEASKPKVIPKPKKSPKTKK